MKRIFPILVVLLIVGGGWYLWSESNHYESTDDAQIDGHLNGISSRISGSIVKVLAEDDQVVKTGDVLVQIDKSDYEVALAKAEAELADAQANLRGSRVDIPLTNINTSSQLNSAKSQRLDAGAGVIGAERNLSAAQARLEAAKSRVVEAQANATKAAEDLARNKILVDKDEISRQQYDAAVAAVAATRAQVATQTAAVTEAEQNIVAAQSIIEQNKARVAQADAGVQQASTAPQQLEAKQARVSSAEAQIREKQAAVEQARLNLQYCTIVAPVSGIVGKKTAEVGQNITPGQQLMAVVPINDLWVTANFKETQLRHMQPGQRVDIKVDAFGKTYQGKVERIAGATGSKYSMIPPENATGNYVKVVQRIPVRIRFEPNQDPEHRLRIGFSVNPKVYVQ